jgi:hypothetical protein
MIRQLDHAARAFPRNLFPLLVRYYIQGTLIFPWFAYAHTQGSTENLPFCKRKGFGFSLTIFYIFNRIEYCILYILIGLNITFCTFLTGLNISFCTFYVIWFNLAFCTLCIIGLNIAFCNNTFISFGVPKQLSPRIADKMETLKSHLVLRFFANVHIHTYMDNVHICTYMDKAHEAKWSAWQDSNPRSKNTACDSKTQQSTDSTRMPHRDYFEHGHVSTAVLYSVITITIKCPGVVD